MKVSALFVRSDSIYKELGIDSWDIERDAKKWPGGNPIIAHPPCRAWGKLKAFAKPRPDEKELAIWSIEQIRKWGGVLEHPRHSALWKELKLPTGKQIDKYGGFSISVNQHWFGHLAKKETLLYICGIKPGNIPDIPISFDAIQYTVCSSKKTTCKKEIPKKMREATPEAFAKWLIELAKMCKMKRLD